MIGYCLTFIFEKRYIDTSFWATSDWLWSERTVRELKTKTSSFADDLVSDVLNLTIVLQENKQMLIPYCPIRDYTAIKAPISIVNNLATSHFHDSNSTLATFEEKAAPLTIVLHNRSRARASMCLTLTINLIQTYSRGSVQCFVLF